MYHYLFTNDLRISHLKDSLVEAGSCFMNDNVPSANEDKNANNNMNTLGFYFNLTKSSHCAVLCANNNVRTVVLNFIKKFQFPNPRTKESFENAIADGIQIAPMRIILRLLYMMNMQGLSDAYLTKFEIADFIFFNDAVAKSNNVDYLTIIKQIEEYRKNGSFPSTVEKNDVNRQWKQETRQVREMVKVLTWSGCVKEDTDGNIRLESDPLTSSNKADLYDILTYKDFWNPEGEEFNDIKLSYQKYMDINDEVTKELDFDLENIYDYSTVLNRNLYGIHITEKNTALSEDNPHICIGWSEMGDLSNIESKDELSDLYSKHFERNNRARGQDVGQIWKFYDEMSVGDYIIFAENSVFHIGKIESDYYFDDNQYDEQSYDYKNTRKVTWLKKNISRNVISTDFHNSLKAARSVWSLNDYRAAVVDLLNDEYEKEDIDDSVISSTVNFKTGCNNKGLAYNRILFGAPGTGKSFTVNRDRVKLLGEDNEDDYERVTFHPDYSYANFVGTYKPVPTIDNDGKDAITYEYVPGPFMRMYVKALKNSRTDNIKPFLLIIEEINRANVAAVFGDVFQLLDRGDDFVSEYPIQATEDIKKYLAKELGGNPDDYNKIKIPDNMFIWATMNSADQGVFPMDTAFKRRWDFTYLGIDDNDQDLQGKYVYLADDKSQKVEWNKLRKAINNFLAKEKINEDKQLGPYFISRSIVVPNDSEEIDRDRFINTFKNKVIMYLFEDAAKQKRPRLFEGCFQNSSRYSEICREFEAKGVGIFNHDIQLDCEVEDVKSAEAPQE